MYFTEVIGQTDHIYRGELQFRTGIYDHGKVQSSKPDFRWCVLESDYVLSLYKMRNDKTPANVLLIPGNVIQYGDDELKTDSLIRDEDRKNVR